MKNEANYLLEWIAYHHWAGFEHFYIADHQSSDETASMLSNLHKAGIVTFMDWPVATKAQFKWYNYAVKQFGQQTDFMAFLDADEFLFSTRGTRPTTELETLMQPSDVGAVAINWQIFGSAGQIEHTPGLVLERFNKASLLSRQVNMHVKSVVKPSLTRRIWPHTAELAPHVEYVASDGAPPAFVDANPLSGRATAPNAGSLLVRHYAVKSFEEFTTNKSKRGRANLGEKHCRDVAYFNRHDINDYDVVVEQEILRQVNFIMHDLEYLHRPGLEQ
ncbi:MAG: glycosyltransferase family 2 protein [Pseudomonadota bacterium]